MLLFVVLSCTPVANVADPCVSDADCDDGLQCQHVDFDGWGLGGRMCTRECAIDEDCPPDGLGFPVRGSCHDGLCDIPDKKV